MENMDELDPIEYLIEIKKRENEFLQNLKREGRLEEYILWLHEKMLNDYPDMILDVITDENNFERGM